MTLINLGRGLTRIWIVVLAAVEIVLCLIVVPITIRVINDWKHENPFDQFDPNYESIIVRLTPLIALLVFTPIAGFVVWLIARWIWLGFTD